MCIYTYNYINMYIYMCVYIYVYMYVYMYIHIHTYTYAFVYIYIYIYICCIIYNYCIRTQTNVLQHNVNELRQTLSSEALSVLPSGISSKVIEDTFNHHARFPHEATLTALMNGPIRAKLGTFYYICACVLN